jgi:hypothetical protein
MPRPEQPPIPEPPFDRLSPAEVHDAVDEATNMTVGELEAYRASENFGIYAERKSGGQPPTEPLDDAIELLDTPKPEYDDDLADEGRELLGFLSRSVSDSAGEPMPGTDPPLSKDTAEDLAWGWDPFPDRADFTGDRQR